MPPLGSMWPAVRTAAALVALASVAGAQQSAAPPEPEVNAGAPSHGATLTTKTLDKAFIHLNYSFQIFRGGIERHGVGELWVYFAESGPFVRLQGEAKSPKYGKGRITLLADVGRKSLYAQFELLDLNKHECIKYPFPKASDYASRMKRLLWRRDQLKGAGGSQKPELNAFELQWTRSKTLKLDFDMYNDLRDIKLVRDLQIRKVVNVLGISAMDTIPTEARRLFEPPSDNCIHATREDDPVAELMLKPPHHKSSALNDLLLALTADEPMPQLFLVLSALAVPGDVAVMIDEPSPPKLDRQGGVAFDYTSLILSHGQNRRSNGTLWVDLGQRAMRLSGKAAADAIGPLHIDLIARGSEGKVFTNVNLTAQRNQQCVSYDYPEPEQKPAAALTEVAQLGLRFVDVAELNGEDCEIFEAKLTRGRVMRVWVDTETDTPDAILRSEVFHADVPLRRTDILGWRQAQDMNISLHPMPEWHCSEDRGTGQVAMLGLHKVHNKSFELQDALFALRHLSGQFTVLEVLALIGDVGIMVREPPLPALFELSTVSFEFDSQWKPLVPGRPATIQMGRVVADLERGLIRMDSGGVGVTNFSIVVGSEIIAVRATAPGQAPQCLTLDLVSGNRSLDDDKSMPEVPIIFDSVDAIGDIECNRFTILGTGTVQEILELWNSVEDNAVLRLELLPPASHSSNQGAATALFNMRNWSTAAAPSTLEVDVPKDWGCVPASSVAHPWLRREAARPSTTRKPGPGALAAMSQAMHMLGMTKGRVANALEHLGIHEPGSEGRPDTPDSNPTATKTTSSTTSTTSTSSAPPALVNFRSPDLRSFSLTFSSTYPMQRPAHSHEDAGSINGGPRQFRQRKGQGELHVDLVGRRLYFRSEAKNVSSGIHSVESRVIFRPDRGHLYARTRVEPGGFEQCWRVRTTGMVQPKPGSYQLNPFQRATFSGDGFAVRGHRTEKYVLHLDPNKRVSFFVGEHSAPLAMNFDDLKRDVSVAIDVHHWSTGPADDDLFEPHEAWKCEEKPVGFLESAHHVAEWDLMRVFLPVDRTVVERRLNFV